MKDQSRAISSLESTNVQQSALLSELRTDTKTIASKVDTMIGETRQLTTSLDRLTIAQQRRNV
jgi:hypothetical protein